MDLKEKFGTVGAMETDGVDVHLGGDAFVTVRRAGGSNLAYLRETRRMYSKHKRAIDAGSIEGAEAERLLMDVYAATIVTGWRGVELDGAALEFNRANVTRLFVEVPEVFRIIKEEAERIANFQAAQVDEQGKDSRTI